ncbi:hypothetical protein ARMSODRAFT_737160 [Armillaria solidipes]|uniref:Uncharacterized protein n=1 Tax=Armillaria solidipes TaxID=1076256 RepID=A0A2H3ATL7_9AGAR|nr:hypothetical protein ARMSODRAFT_737160 [Armillaria solidipes]
MDGEASHLSACCIAMMARHKLHASRGCIGSAYEDMNFIARSWLCATINESINIQLKRKDTSNEPLYLADVSKASISIGEDDFVLLCGRGVFCLYGGTTSEARLSSKSNPLPKISTIDLVMSEARLRIQCLHAFLRPLSFPRAPILRPPRSCLLRNILMRVD